MTGEPHAIDRWFITGGGLLSDGGDRPDLAGQRVGPYRVAEEIGRGGMATVYRGQRDDGAFEQQVAIKVFELPPDSPIAQRFRDERQLLADLDHPGIARIYDGGELPSGAPYLVLEFVRGAPLDRYARELSLDARLDLFREICDAVAAAHGEGVVHHDLKPDNILVDRHGHPKLLDFGIASALASEAESSQRLFTPRHAAPEQFDGKPAGRATDVFQLGMLLHELATGQAATAGDSIAVLKKRASMLPLLPASEADAPWQRRLDRSLDQIIGTALAPDPTARYASVQALRADVEAWRTGQPTSLASTAAGARAARWARRRLGMVAGGVFVIGALAAILTWTVREVDRARERSRAMSELVTDVLTPTGEGRDRIADHSFEIASGAVADQPRLERELARVSAERLLADGNHEAAIDLLEPVLTRAMGGFEGGSTDLTRLQLLLGQAYRAAKRPDAALRTYEAGIRIADRVGAEPPSNDIWRALLRGRAIALIDLGESTAALAALATARRAAPDDSDDARDLEAARTIVTAGRHGECGAPSTMAAGPVSRAARIACERGLFAGGG